MPLNRRRAREVALQVLYADDLNPQRDLTEADEFLCRRLRDVDALVAFARGIVSGVRRCRVEIDAALSRQASNWSLDRMAAIDRNLLRLGVFELLHTETPPPVVLNEVIELAKRFGGRQSHQFVNGVLDKLVPPQRAGARRRPTGDKPNPSMTGATAAGHSAGGHGAAGHSAAGHGVGGGNAAASSGAPKQTNARPGVISRYGLTVRPRTSATTDANATGAKATGASSASQTATNPNAASANPTNAAGVAGRADSSRADATVHKATDGLAAPDSAAPDSTAPDSTAPDSTAPDSTAPDSTAPDSVAAGAMSVPGGALDTRQEHQQKGAADGIV